MGLQSWNTAAWNYPTARFPADCLRADVSREASLGWAFSTTQVFQRKSEIKVSTCCSHWGRTPSTVWELCQARSGSQFGLYWPENSRKNLIRLYNHEKERYWIKFCPKFTIGRISSWELQTSALFISLTQSKLINHIWGVMFFSHFYMESIHIYFSCSKSHSAHTP